MDEGETEGSSKTSWEELGSPELATLAEAKSCIVWVAMTTIQMGSEIGLG